MRVLVADDDPVALRLISDCLRTLGYQIDAARDGLMAQQLFLRRHFPIVITDWEMPGLSGPELCQRIRERESPGYTYIILWSHRSERRDLIQGLSAGADDFVAKPFDADEIRVRLRAAERVLSLERQLLEANRKLTLMNSRLRKMSRLDPLMEIGNRMAFEEELATFHHHAAGYSQPYGVVMCDVDRFKQVNDQFGHQYGDEILRQTAGEIRGAIRSQDLAFRYGGEEILLLLGGQDLQSSTAVAERIRRQVEQLRFSFQAGEVCSITISCGIAAYPENFDAAHGWRGLVERADQALYQAKDAGRNRVVPFSTTGVVPADHTLAKDTA